MRETRRVNRPFAGGVRPSPGAAMLSGRATFGFFPTFGRKSVAAPGDGRTPLTAERNQSRWKTSLSGVATGELSGCTCMSGAMASHHLRTMGERAGRTPCCCRSIFERRTASAFPIEEDGVIRNPRRFQLRRQFRPDFVVPFFVFRHAARLHLNFERVPLHFYFC